MGWKMFAFIYLAATFDKNKVNLYTHTHTHITKVICALKNKASLVNCAVNKCNPLIENKCYMNKNNLFHSHGWCWKPEKFELLALPLANWKDIYTNLKIYSGILVAPNKQAGKMNY